MKEELKILLDKIHGIQLSTDNNDIKFGIQICRILLIDLIETKETDELKRN